MDLFGFQVELGAEFVIFCAFFLMAMFFLIKYAERPMR